ncbi:MAG TPA: tetratricopeptide repeat protein, partial [Candidatus Saccharimonadales bacterium]|nr:tetratricopeptide repeat protein [Candidatus Saccharimonadales bacterium]
GLSQAQLGAPHFTRAYVSAIELGKVRPAMKSLDFMAEKLGKPTSYFIEDAEANHRRQERAVTVARGNQLISEGRAAEAIPLFEAMTKAVASPSDRAILQRSLGRAYTQADRAPEAIAVLNDALRFFKTIDDSEQIARTRSQLGAALLAMRTFAEAQSELESALAFMSKVDVKDPLLKVHTVYNLGVSFYMRGDYHAAALQFERAAREGADVADLRWQAGLFAGMGMSYSKLEDFEAAVTYLRKSEALFEAINNKFRAIESRLRAALSLKALGQRTKADELLTSALEGARSFGADALKIEIASCQASLWAEDGRYDEAIALASAALADAERAGDPVLRVIAMMALARSVNKADPKRTIQILRDAVVVAGDQSGLEYAELFNDLSVLLAENGLADEALRYSRKAYNVARKKK